MSFKKYILTAFIFLYNVSNAQKSPWTLKECIEYAYKNNLKVKQSLIDKQINKLEYTKTKGRFLPNLSFDADHAEKLFNKSNVPGNTSSLLSESRFFLRSNLNLFNGFKDWHLYKQRQLALRNTENLIESKKNSLSLEIAKVYLEILTQKQILKAAEQRWKISKKQREVVQTMVKSGAQAKAQETEAELDENQAKMSVIEAKNNIEGTFIELKYLLQMDLNNSLDIEDFKTNLIEDVSDINIETQIDKKVEIQFLINELEQKKYALKIEQGYYFPKLDLSYRLVSQYNHYKHSKALSNTRFDDGFWDQIKNNRKHELVLALQVPIFNQLSVKTNIDKLRLDQIQTLMKLDEERYRITKELHRAKTDQERIKNKLKNAIELEKLSEKSFKFAQKRYLAGSMTLIELQTQQSKWFIEQTTRIKTQYEYLFKKMLTRFYAGYSLVD